MFRFRQYPGNGLLVMEVVAITGYSTIKTITAANNPYFKPHYLVREINLHLKMAVLACAAVGFALAHVMDPVVQLSSLNGSIGFRMDGTSI